MANGKRAGIWIGASFLLVLIVLLIFLYAQSFTTSGIFPQNVEFWNKIITGYLVIFALVLIATAFVSREIIISLTKARYWEAVLMRFIPSAIITSIILIILKGIIKGPESINILEAIEYMPLYVVLIHAFVVAQIEEITFAGLLYSAIEKKSGPLTANIWTMVLFGLWHFVKIGGNWTLMLMYAPLRLGWNYINKNGFPGLNKALPRFFGPTPTTVQNSAGSHFAWNMFVISGI